jgi:hypothetical protein
LKEQAIEEAGHLDLYRTPLEFPLVGKPKAAAPTRQRQPGGGYSSQRREELERRHHKAGRQTEANFPPAGKLIPSKKLDTWFPPPDNQDTKAKAIADAGLSPSAAYHATRQGRWWP